MRSMDNMEEALKKKLSFTASTTLHDRILDDVLEAQEDSKTKSALSRPKIRRIIMKSPITKLAAAAVIIIAVLIVINQLGTNGSSFVWADVAESFDSVPFVHITVYIGHDTPVETKRIEIWKSVDSRVRVDEGNTVFFADLSNDKNKITIDRSTKKPVNDYENLPPFIWRLCSKKGRFSLDTLTKSFPSDVEGIIPLETTKTVASSDTVLFQARSKHITPEALKIWALRDSKLPIRFFLHAEKRYADLFFDYSVQKDAAFFDPEAFRSQ